MCAHLVSTRVTQTYQRGNCSWEAPACTYVDLNSTELFVAEIGNFTVRDATTTLVCHGAIGDSLIITRWRTGSGGSLDPSGERWHPRQLRGPSREHAGPPRQRGTYSNRTANCPRGGTNIWHTCGSREQVTQFREGERVGVAGEVDILYLDTLLRAAGVDSLDAACSSASNPMMRSSTSVG
jgi:hypothetical protein